MSDTMHESERDSGLAADLRRTCLSIEQARGLPNGCYTDPAIFEREKTQIFEQGWSCVGFAKDIPEPGDALPVLHLGHPLLLVRTKDRRIKVFHNVCRHRGMILVDAPTRIRSVIRCPYHSWCYGMDGRLKATPHVGGPGHNAVSSIDRAELGLREVRSAVWFDMVFVNPSGQAPAFDAYIGPLSKRWHEVDPGELRHGGPDVSFRLELACNWKLAVENYCESYHLPWVHPGLNSYSRLEDHENIVEPGSYSGQLTWVYNPRRSDDGRRFPNFNGLSDHWRTRADYVALYPNLLLGLHKDHVFAIRLEPISHDRTIEHVEIYFADELALADDMADLRAKLKAMWHEVFVEDVFVVEGMQRGRASSRFDGGVFSPAMDQATHVFHRWVGERLLGDAVDEPHDGATLAEAV